MSKEDRKSFKPLKLKKLPNINLILKRQWTKTCIWLEFFYWKHLKPCNYLKIKSSEIKIFLFLSNKLFKMLQDFTVTKQNHIPPQVIKNSIYEQIERLLACSNRTCCSTFTPIQINETITHDAVIIAIIKKSKKKKCDRITEHLLHAYQFGHIHPH